MFVVGDNGQLVPVEAEQLPGKEIATVDVFLAFTSGAFASAGVDAEFRRAAFVQIVMLAIFEESKQQFTHGLKIGLCRMRGGVRGWMDLLVGGVRIRRARRNTQNYIIGDALNWWRISD